MEISYEVALTIIGSIFAIAMAVTGLYKIYNNNTRHDSDISDMQENLKETNVAISNDIRELEKELKDLQINLTSIQSTLDGKVDIQISNVTNQISEVKETLTRLQTKVEKLTDIIITKFSNRSE